MVSSKTHEVHERERDHYRLRGEVQSIESKNQGLRKDVEKLDNEVREAQGLAAKNGQEIRRQIDILHARDSDNESYKYRI